VSWVRRRLNASMASQTSSSWRGEGVAVRQHRVEAAGRGGAGVVFADGEGFGGGDFGGEPVGSRVELPDALLELVALVADAGGVRDLFLHAEAGVGEVALQLRDAGGVDDGVGEVGEAAAAADLAGAQQRLDAAERVGGEVRHRRFLPRVGVGLVSWPPGQFRRRPRQGRVRGRRLRR